MPFGILPLGTEDDENDLEKDAGFIDESFASMNTLSESKQSSRVAQLFEKHCVSRTYFFKVKKCSDPNCTIHKPIRGDRSIDTFPDPTPQEVDGVLHYQPGIDEEESFLPSTLEDVEKGLTISHSTPPVKQPRMLDLLLFYYPAYKATHL